jgi:hypothetical protein
MDWLLEVYFFALGQLKLTWLYPYSFLQQERERFYQSQYNLKQKIKLTVP